MLESRSLKLDLAALALLAFAVFLGLALATYDPADSLDALTYPPPSHTLNACGRSGALLVDLLFRGIGLGAYYLFVSLAVLDAWLLTRRPISDPVLRGIGWVLSLVGWCTLASLCMAGWSGGPVIGPGGYLGATGRGLLEMHFASAGAYILTISLVIGGLLLCTEYLLPRLAARVLAAPAAALALIRLKAAPSVARNNAKRAPRTDLDDEQIDVDEDNAPPIRIRGKSTAAAEKEEQQEDEVEDHPVVDDAEGEQVAAQIAGQEPLQTPRPPPSLASNAHAKASAKK